MKLTNFFVQCRCGESLRFDCLDQVRVCTCGRILEISKGGKKYLIDEYGADPEQKRRNKIGDALYEMNGEILSFGQFYKPNETAEDDNSKEDILVETIISSGEKLTHHHIDPKTRKAALDFIDRYQKILRRLP